MATVNTPHWTESSPQKFAYRVASDFVEQVRDAMKAKRWSQNKFAKRLKLTPGRVSQILNNPGNLTLETMAQWARELGLKVSVLLYDDGDNKNQRGPVNSEIFRLCWERANKPIDMWSFQQCAQVATIAKDSMFVSQIPKGRHGEGGTARSYRGGWELTVLALSTNKGNASLGALLLDIEEKW